MRVIFDSLMADLMNDWSDWDRDYLETVQQRPNSTNTYVRIKFLESGRIKQVPIRALEIPPAP